ncbi:MAG: hypothetical protein AAGB31_06005 [Bdellovibrio sp.]
MESSNHKGQILIEVCLVMLFIFLIGFAALNQLSDLKKQTSRYQFLGGSSHEKKNSRSVSQ